MLRNHFSFALAAMVSLFLFGGCAAQTAAGSEEESVETAEEALTARELTIDKWERRPLAVIESNPSTNAAFKAACANRCSDFEAQSYRYASTTPTSLDEVIKAVIDLGALRGSTDVYGKPLKLTEAQFITLLKGMGGYGDILPDLQAFAARYNFEVARLVDKPNSTIDSTVYLDIVSFPDWYGPGKNAVVVFRSVYKVQ